MLWQLKLVGIIFGGVMTIVAATMLYQAYDIKMNYTLVEAKIVSVETDCFVERGKQEIVDEKTKKRAYMDCSKAISAALQNGFDRSDIQKRANVTYQYISPADSNKYSGNLTRARDVENLTSGRKIMVHAHKAEPENSRTTKSNLFIPDSGV